MKEYQKLVCNATTSKLYKTDPSHHKYGARMELANQIELQMLAGNPIYDTNTIMLCLTILFA